MFWVDESMMSFVLPRHHDLLHSTNIFVRREREINYTHGERTKEYANVQPLAAGPVSPFAFGRSPGCLVEDDDDYHHDENETKKRDSENKESNKVAHIQELNIFGSEDKMFYEPSLHWLKKKKELNISQLLRDQKSQKHEHSHS